MVGENIVTIQEAAKITGLTERTIRHFCDLGKIPARKIGARYIIDADWAIEERNKRRRPAGYISIDEAAIIAGVSRQRIYQLVKSGQVKAQYRQHFRKRYWWVSRISLELWSREKEPGIRKKTPEKPPQ